MTGNDEYTTIIGNVAEGFYSEKRSKFYAFAHHVTSEAQVKDIVQKYRKDYYDARHVCYAYVLGAESECFRANDDGEPSSTAGKPILGQIIKNELTDVLVVVIRYYGGVNLGTGGLIVAYRTAAAAALAAAQTRIFQVEENVRFCFPYELMNDVMRVVKDMSPKVISQDYNNSMCEMLMSIRKSGAEELRDRLEKIKLHKGL